MGLYNFQPRFVPHILAGTKTHTIRAIRRYPDKPGNTLYLYTGLRRPEPRLLLKAKCVKIEEIVIDTFGLFENTPGYGKPVIRIDGRDLDDSEMQLLARLDGFINLAEMMKFWDGRLPFRGQIIHWSSNV